MNYRVSVAAAAVTVAVLAACGESQLPTSALGALAQTHSIATHTVRGKSWMLPQGKRTRRLLYISDSSAAVVDIYSYDTGELVGQLSGFKEPRGQCVDATGDVWIADYGAQAMIEYAHGGTAALKTLTTEFRPFGCSISPSGDLAASVSGSSNDAIQVWTKASGSPTIYTGGGACEYLTAPGYDENGRLYAEGDEIYTSGYLVRACEADEKTHSLTGILFTSSIHGPESPMWDGANMTMRAGGTSGSKHAAIYPVVPTERGRRLKHVGRTLLADDCQSYVRIDYLFIVGKHNTPVNHTIAYDVVGVDGVCTGEFDYWRYPAGGAPYKTLAIAPTKITGDSVSISR